MSETYDAVNRAWKSTCKVLLGDEVGELSDYSNWLYDGNGPRIAAKSSISGKEVIFPLPKYAKGAPCISFDEVDYGATAPNLSINEIKDLDSLIRAISDKAFYAGNIVLGNSKFVEASSTINDSFYILHSERVAFSKYVAYSTRGSYSENIFGCHYFGPARFDIKCQNPWDCTRCLGVIKCDFSSDCYFSHGLSSCQDCMFCFNMKNKRYFIGNLALDKGKYLEIKSKLIGEMREMLMAKKRLPTLSELISTQKPDFSLLLKMRAQTKPAPLPKDKTKIEKSFSETTSIVLGKKLTGISSYALWLAKNSWVSLQKAKSCLSGTPLLVPTIANLESMPHDRLLTLEEAEDAGATISLSAEEAGRISMSNCSSLLSKLAYFSPQWEAGNSRNNISCPINIDSSDCFSGIQNMKSKLCGVCLVPRDCEQVFGSRDIRESSFCINCFFTTKSVRCFECDSCRDCSDSYFCHNCENVKESMFCFNVKNKQYAIGNYEVGREKYLQIKKMLLDEIGARLEKDKSLGIDIYTIGGKQK